MQSEGTSLCLRDQTQKKIRLRYSPKISSPDEDLRVSEESANLAKREDRGEEAITRNKNGEEEGDKRETRFFKRKAEKRISSSAHRHPSRRHASSPSPSPAEAQTHAQLISLPFPLFSPPHFPFLLPPSPSPILPFFPFSGALLSVGEANKGGKKKRKEDGSAQTIASPLPPSTRASSSFWVNFLSPSSFAATLQVRELGKCERICFGFGGIVPRRETGDDCRR